MQYGVWPTNALQGNFGQSRGSLPRDGKTYMELAPWTMFFPALTLAGLILAINLLGDELQAGSTRGYGVGKGTVALERVGKKE